MTIQTAGQAVRAAHTAIETYRAQEEELARSLGEVQRDLAANRDRLRAAYDDLAHALLPAADAETVQRAASATGYARLGESFARLEQAQRQRVARREAIEEMAEFRDRDLLLHPTTGTLAVQAREAEENLAASAPQVKRYEDVPGFRGLAERHGKPQSPAARLVGRILLFGFVVEWMRSNAQRRLLEAFPGSTVDRCVSDYHEARKTRDFWQDEAKRHRAGMARVEELVREHETLGRDVSEFGTGAATVLRGELAEYFGHCEAFAEIRQAAPEGARVAASTVLALRQKQEYLSRMAGYLAREVADRQQRQNQIRSVSAKWQRNPGKRLSGDKTQWLVTGPARKAESTRRNVVRVHTVRTTIVDFDDWYLYDRVLDDADDVLAWDVFARASDERMPGDAFVQEVIPDVADHRRDYGAPDYDAIDGAASSIGIGAVAGIAATTVAISALAASELAADALDGDWADDGVDDGVDDGAVDDGGDGYDDVSEDGGDGGEMEDAS